jgi:hypothetical protein
MQHDRTDYFGRQNAESQSADLQALIERLHEHRFIGDGTHLGRAMTREEIKQHLIGLSYADLMNISADSLCELVQDEDVVVVRGRFYWSEFLGAKVVGGRKDGEE